MPTRLYVCLCENKTKTRKKGAKQGSKSSCLYSQSSTLEFARAWGTIDQDGGDTNCRNTPRTRVFHRGTKLKIYELMYINRDKTSRLLLIGSKDATDIFLPFDLRFCQSMPNTLVGTYKTPSLPPSMYQKIPRNLDSVAGYSTSASIYPSIRRDSMNSYTVDYAILESFFTTNTHFCPPV